MSTFVAKFKFCNLLLVRVYDARQFSMQKWHAKSLYKLKVTVSEVTERKKRKGWQKFEVLRK